MTDPRNRLLKEQIEQCFGTKPLPEELKPFLEQISKAYGDFEYELAMFEKASQYNSEDLRQLFLEVQVMFNAFPDNFFLRIDADGKIFNYRTGSNENWTILTDSLAGKNIHSLSDTALSKIFIENITKSKSCHSIVNVEYTHCINGSNIYFDVRFIPLNTDQTIVIFVNLTNQRKDENAMKRLIAAMESVNDMIVITDINGNIQYVNKSFEQATEYKQEEVLGKKPSVLKSGKQKEKFYKHLWETIKKGEIWRGVFINKKKNGSLYDVETIITPVFDGNGQIINYVAVSRDVTKRKQSEQLQKQNEDEIKLKNESLKKNEKALRNMLIDLKETHDNLKNTQGQLLQSEKLAYIGQLAAGVAHEINNPLGFISNNIEVLGQYIENYTKILRLMEDVKHQVDAGDVMKAKKGVDEIRKIENEIDLDYIISDGGKLLDHTNRGLERIRKIVTDLNTFAREDNARITETIKVEDVINNILSIVNNELKYKAEIIKEYTDVPPVRCNVQQLGQVLINLLINAGQAIEDKGKITIKTYYKNGFVYTDVVDTGKGIPEENLTKIFDPFFTTKPVGKGTGLGLSVSHEIIKKHGGEISVQSTVGEGATFTVRLPSA